MYIRELRAQYRLRRVAGRASPIRIVTSADAAAAFGHLLRHEAVEVCGMFCLTTTHDVLAYHELSRGTVDATLVHPREVFKIALLSNARAVIVGHNHPSGDLSPSPDDLAITRRLVSAGDLIGIDVLDHLILAGDRYRSLRDAGQF